MTARIARRSQLEGLRVDDLYDLNFIDDVALAPNGTDIAFSMRTASAEVDADTANICLLTGASASPTPVTGGPCRDRWVSWSPDGSVLAFICSTPDEPSVHRLKVLSLESTGSGQTGEPRDLGPIYSDNVYPSSTTFAWAPTSDRICFVAWAPDERERPTAYVFDDMPYKTAEDGWDVGRRKKLFVVGTLSGEVAALTDGPFNESQPTWSPDGQEIVFVSSLPDSGPAGYASKGLWAVPSMGGNVRLIGEAHGSVAPSPSFSPDGTRVAFFGHDHPNAGYARDLHLRIVSREGGQSQDMTPDWDYGCGSVVMSDVHDLLAPQPPVWSDDSKELYFLGTVEGTANIYAASATSALLPRNVTSGQHEVIAWSCSSAGDFAAIVSDATNPGRLSRGSIRDHDLETVYDPNQPLLSSRSLSEPRYLAIPTDNDKRVHAWLYLPHDSAEPSPMVMQLLPGVHFTWGWSFNLEFQVLAAAGHAVLCVSPRGASSFGSEHKEGLGDVLWGNDCELSDVMAAVDFASGLGEIDSMRLGVTGDASGGTTTNLLVTRDQRFSAAAARRSASNLVSMFGTSDRGASGGQMMWFSFGKTDPYANHDAYWNPSPLQGVADVETPLLLMCSEGDMREPLGQAEEMFVALRFLSKPARLVVYPTRTHFLSRAGLPSQRAHFFTTILAWFDRYLK